MQIETVNYQTTMSLRYIFTALLSVTIPAQSVPGQQIQRLQAVRDLKIGDENDDNYVFESISGAIVGDDGSITILDARARKLRKFDANGKFVMSTGRAGNGPGEYQSIRAFGHLKDTVWISDGTLNRVTLLSSTGRVEKTLTLMYDPRHRALSPSAPSALMTDGMSLVFPDAIGEVAQQTANLLRPLVRVNRKNEAVDTVTMLRFGTPYMFPSRGSVFAFQPFNDGPIWKAQSDGSAVIIVDRTVAQRGVPTYSVRRVLAGGKVAFSRTYQYSPQPITGAVLDSIFDAGSRELSKPNPPTPSGTKMVRENLFVPSHWPPILNVVAGRDGTTWMQVRRPTGNTNSWDVLDQRGERILSVDIPSTARILQADRKFVWCAEFDSSDVPVVVRYRLAPPRD